MTRGAWHRDERHRNCNTWRISGVTKENLRAGKTGILGLSQKVKSHLSKQRVRGMGWKKGFRTRLKRGRICRVSTGTPGRSAIWLSGESQRSNMEGSGEQTYALKAAFRGRQHNSGCCTLASRKNWPTMVKQDNGCPHTSEARLLGFRTTVSGRAMELWKKGQW